MSEHVCSSSSGLFCECGKLVDREGLRSIALRATPPGSKTTVDQHDHHSVEVTEHWDDRVDVTMKPETIHLSSEG